MSGHSVCSQRSSHVSTRAAPPVVPQLSTDPVVGFEGWLAPGERPQVLDPAGGLLWSANARVVGGDEDVGDVACVVGEVGVAPQVGVGDVGAEDDEPLEGALGELAVTIERPATVVAQARSRLAGQMPDGATRLVSLHDPAARPIRV